jgi:hypothetical protein
MLRALAPVDCFFPFSNLSLRGKTMKRIKEKALKLANKKIAFVGSVNNNNAPNIKAMLVVKHDGLKTFYFASNNSAMRTEQYKYNNNACIYFNGGLFIKGSCWKGQWKY